MYENMLALNRKILFIGWRYIKSYNIINIVCSRRDSNPRKKLEMFLCNVQNFILIYSAG